MLNTRFFLQTPEHTHRAGFWLGQHCVPPLFIGLNGNLGAGKTALSQGFARGLGITERVTSPTYNLLSVYEGPRGMLYHLDIYRLQSIEAVFDLDLESALDTPSIILMEWKNKFDGWELGMPELDITLEHAETGRWITLKSPHLPPHFAASLQEAL